MGCGSSKGTSDVYEPVLPPAPEPVPVPAPATEPNAIQAPAPVAVQEVVAAPTIDASLTKPKPLLPQPGTVTFTEFKDGEKVVVDSILDSRIHLRMAAINFKELKLQKIIGQGAFGEVIKGTYHGTPVVVKRMVRQKIDPENIRMFADEIQLMMNLRHPNIVQVEPRHCVCCRAIHRCVIVHRCELELVLQHVLSDPFPFHPLWLTIDTLMLPSCFVTEFLDRGDLYSVLKNPRVQLSWKQPLLSMAIDISRGMAYLHSMDPPIIHRDLKSMNILVRYFMPYFGVG
ncbi:hypothetical protein DYB32_005661 [Aphanomyces invadans]|uniref:Protein kinase domain-containing protein n=1 Tax=Aphanomyces invadans TaxID=157072 RepID=A0A3R7A7Z3_9STRA|nr:hypothetical protein DYB32_005661 [Aphanomyces invadans]